MPWDPKIEAEKKAKADRLRADREARLRAEREAARPAGHVPLVNRAGPLGGSGPPPRGYNPHPVPPGGRHRSAGRRGSQDTHLSHPSHSRHRAAKSEPKSEPSEGRHRSAGRRGSQDTHLSHPSHSRHRATKSEPSSSPELLDLATSQPRTASARSARTAHTLDLVTSQPRTASTGTVGTAASRQRNLSRDPVDLPPLTVINTAKGTEVIKWGAANGHSYNDFLAEQVNKGIDPAQLGNTERTSNYAQYRAWLKTHYANKQPRPAPKPMPRAPRPVRDPVNVRAPDRNARAPPVVSSSDPLGSIKRDLPPENTNNTSAVPARNSAMQAGRLASGQAGVRRGKQLALQRFMDMSPAEVVEIAKLGQATVTWNHFATHVLHNPNAAKSARVLRQYKKWFLARMVMPSRTVQIHGLVAPSPSPAPQVHPHWKPSYSKEDLKRIPKADFPDVAKREGVYGFTQWLRHFNKRGKDPGALHKQWRRWATQQMMLPPNTRAGAAPPRGPPLSSSVGVAPVESKWDRPTLTRMGGSDFDRLLISEGGMGYKKWVNKFKPEGSPHEKIKLWRNYATDYLMQISSSPPVHQRPPRLPAIPTGRIPLGVPQTMWTKGGLNKLIRQGGSYFSNVAEQHGFGYDKYLEEFGRSQTRGQNIQEKWHKWAIAGILEDLALSAPGPKTEDESEEGELPESDGGATPDIATGHMTPVHTSIARPPPPTPQGKKDLAATMKAIMVPGPINRNLTSKMGFSQWQKFAAYKSAEIGQDLSWEAYQEATHSATRSGWRTMVLEEMARFYAKPGVRAYQQVDYSDSGPHGRYGVQRPTYPGQARVLESGTPPPTPARRGKTKTGQLLSPAKTLRKRPRTGIMDAEVWEEGFPFDPNADWMNDTSSNNAYPPRASPAPSPDTPRVSPARSPAPGSPAFVGTYDDVFSDASKEWASADAFSDPGSSPGYQPPDLSDYPGDMPELERRSPSVSMLSQSPDPYAGLASPIWSNQDSDSAPVLRDSSLRDSSGSRQGSPILSPTHIPFSPYIGSPAPFRPSPSPRPPRGRLSDLSSPSSSPPGSPMGLAGGRGRGIWPGGILPGGIPWVPRGGRGRGFGRGGRGGRGLAPWGGRGRGAPPAGPPAAPAPAPAPVVVPPVVIQAGAYPQPAAPRRNVHRRRIIPVYTSGTNRAMAGMAAWSKTPEFSFKNTAPGRYTIRAFRGVTKDVRTHLRALIRKAPHSLWVNGKKMNKKQAFSLIIDLLNKLEVVQVGLSN